MADVEAQIVAAVYREMASELRMGGMRHTADSMEAHAASIEMAHGRLPPGRKVTDEERKEVRDVIFEQMGSAVSSAFRGGRYVVARH